MTDPSPTFGGFVFAVLVTAVMVLVVFGLCDVIANPPPGPLNYTLTRSDSGIGVVVDETVYDHYSVYENGYYLYMKLENSVTGATIWTTESLEGPIEQPPVGNSTGDYTYPPWLACNGQEPALEGY